MRTLLDSGEISAAEVLHRSAANVITPAAGTANPELTGHRPVVVRLRFLFCGDWLFKTLPEPSLAETLAADHDDIP